MMEFLNLFNLLVPGFLLSAIFWKFGKKTQTIDISFILRSALWSIILVSLVGILLLEFSIFSLLSFQVVFGTFNVILLALNFRFGHFRVVLPSIKVTWFAVAFALLMFLNIFLKTPISHFIYGGQDQGVYVNTANELASTGDIGIHDPFLKLAFTNDEFSFLQKNYLEYPKTTITQDRYEGWFTPGYYITDFEEGAVVPQFFHLHTIWMSLSNLILGQDSTPLPLLLFSLLTIPFFYLFLQLFLKSPFLALFIVFLYSVNFLTVWINRYPLSETLAFFLLLTGFYYLYRLYKEESHENELEESILAGLAFGFFSFVRGDGLLLLPAFSLVYLLLPCQRKYIIVFNLYFVFLTLSILHALAFSFPYTYDVFEDLHMLFFPVRHLLLWYLLIFAGYFTMVNAIKYFFRDFIEHLVHWFKNIPVRFYTLFWLPLLILWISRLAYFLFSKSDSEGSSFLIIVRKLTEIFTTGETFNVSFLQFIILLSPLVFIGACIGLIKSYKYVKESWILILFFTYHFIYQYLFIFEQGALPYYGRYQFLEALPFGMLFFGIFLKAYNESPRWKVRMKKLVSILVIGFYLVPHFINPVYSKTELSGAYESLVELSRHIEGDNAVVFSQNKFLFRLAAPLMYSFRKGNVFLYDSVQDVLENGGKLMSKLGANVYVLTDDPLDENSSCGENLGLRFVTKGLLPVYTSATTTRFPKGWENADHAYYFYRLTTMNDNPGFCKKTIIITPESKYYTMEGLNPIAESVTGNFAWTGNSLLIYDVPIYPDTNSSGPVLLSFENAGYFPPTVTLNLEILVNGEQICEFQGSGKSKFAFTPCVIPNKFYNSDVNIHVNSTKWVPKEIWPDTSTDERTLGIDFKKLEIKFPN